MKKATSKEQRHQTIIMVMVSLVAILAIMSANKQTNNVGGQAVNEDAMECETARYCTDWEWSNTSNPVCLEYLFVEYKECNSYSWPLNEKGEPEMKCDSWNIVYKNECVKWEENTSWDRKCKNWQTKKDCYAVI